jgi:hypothetical protein
MLEVAVDALIVVGLFKEQLIPINYDNDVTEVYRTFTQAIIEMTGELEILHSFGTSRRIDNLQSWVPDYSISRPVGLLPRAHESWTCSLDFPSRILPGLEFRDTDLLIKGRFLDTVSGVGNEMDVDVVPYTGSDEFISVLHGWESLASTLISNKNFPETLSEAFWQTITAHDNIYKNGKTTGFDWYKIYGTGVLEDMDSKPFQDHQDLRSIEKWAGISGQSRHEFLISHFTREMEMVCYGRKFFVTEGGTMGMATPRAQAGDRIIFLAGGVYPFVLRSCNDGGFTLAGDCFLFGLDECSLFREGMEPAETYVLH